MSSTAHAQQSLDETELVQSARDGSPSVGKAYVNMQIRTIFTNTCSFLLLNLDASPSTTISRISDSVRHLIAL